MLRLLEFSHKTRNDFTFGGDKRREMCIKSSVVQIFFFYFEKHYWDIFIKYSWNIVDMGSGYFDFEFDIYNLWLLCNPHFTLLFLPD